MYDSGRLKLFLAEFPATQDASWFEMKIWEKIMLVIKVWCLPRVTEKKLRKLHKNIVAAVVSVKKLGLKNESDMTCLFPSDMMSYGLGEEIIIEITSTLDHLQRPGTIQQQLAMALGNAVYALGATFPNARVECSFSPIREYWSSQS